MSVKRNKEEKARQFKMSECDHKQMLTLAAWRPEASSLTRTEFRQIVLDVIG